MFKSGNKWKFCSFKINQEYQSKIRIRIRIRTKWDRIRNTGGEHAIVPRERMHYSACLSMLRCDFEIAYFCCENQCINNVNMLPLWGKKRKKLLFCGRAHNRGWGVDSGPQKSAKVVVFNNPRNSPKSAELLEFRELNSGGIEKIP